MSYISRNLSFFPTFREIRTGERRRDVGRNLCNDFRASRLADVYQIIAHYLNHTAEIDAYLSERHTEAEGLEREIETRFNPVGVRSRLLARRKATNATQRSP